MAIASNGKDVRRVLHGVYYCTLAFLPLLMKAAEAHIVNMSSRERLLASIGPNRPHKAPIARRSSQ